MALKIAFATCEELPDFTDNDRLAAEALGRLGVEVVPAVWSAPRDWAALDAVVIRATWFYWLRYPEFLGWISRLEAARVPTFNPVGILRWNTDKRYLARLARQGLPVVPTEWLVPGDLAQAEAIARAPQGPEQVILKPVVSGGAWRTHLLDRARLGEARAELEEIWSLGPAMVQPFLPEIRAEGEHSFIFFDGELSHVVLKRAAAEEFRVQHTFGGTSASVRAPSAWVDRAREVIRAATGEAPLYARVDMVRRGGEWLLMELEMTEPNLFFGDAPGSAERFASCALRRIEAARRSRG